MPLSIRQSSTFSRASWVPSDDEDTIRLNGSPLFTLSDGTKNVLFDGTDHAFTWPTEVPARLTAHAYDRCRWHAIFFGDRIIIKMDRDWTQFEKAYFTIPGKWISPQDNPQWRRIVTADGSDVDINVETSSHISVSAAEFYFPDQSGICVSNSSLRRKFSSRVLNEVPTR